MQNFDWNSCCDNNIDIYTSNFTRQLISLCEATIPNKIVTIRTADPPWLHTNIRKEIRRRKRAYKKAKATNLDRHWHIFRQQRNIVNNLVRSAKKVHFENLAKLIRENQHSSSDFWKIIKKFTNKKHHTKRVASLNS